jgi:hypothetical protein
MFFLWVIFSLFLFISHLCNHGLEGCNFSNNKIYRQVSNDNASVVSKSISNSWRITILSESTIMSARLDSSLEGLHSTKKESKDSSLLIFGEIFGYEKVLSESQNTFLFQLYGRTDALPFLCDDEFSVFFKNVFNIVKPYSAGLFESQNYFNFLSNDIVAKLNPSQIEALERFQIPSSERMGLPPGLPVKDFSPELRSNVWKWCMGFYLDFPLEAAWKINRYIEDITERDCYLRWNEREKTNFFGLEIRNRVNTATPRFLPLSHPKMVNLLDGGKDSWSYTRLFDTSENEKVSSDATAPSAKNTDAKHRYSNENFITLKEVIQVLNSRRESNDPPFSVEPSLENKPIIASGLEYSKPNEIMEGIARLYGLRVRSAPASDSPTGKIIELTFPRSVTVNTVSDVPEAILHRIPYPLLRDVVSRAEKISPPKPSQEGKTLSIHERFKKIPKATLKTVTDQMSVLAIRYLRESVEPKIQDHAEKRLSYKELMAEEKSLICLSLMVRALPSLHTMITTLPLPICMILTVSFCMVSDGRGGSAMA